MEARGLLLNGKYLFLGWEAMPVSTVRWLEEDARGSAVGSLLNAVRGLAIRREQHNAANYTSKLQGCLPTRYIPAGGT